MSKSGIALTAYFVAGRTYQPEQWVIVRIGVLVQLSDTVQIHSGTSIMVVSIHDMIG